MNTFTWKIFTFAIVVTLGIWTLQTNPVLWQVFQQNQETGYVIAGVRA